MEKRISVPVQEDFHNAIHQKADAEGLPVTEVVRGSLELYLAGKIRIERKAAVATIIPEIPAGEAA